MPRQINYQGLLTSPGGTPVTATVSMEFRVYAVASGPDAPLYSETQSNVAVTNGVFSVLIGSVTPIPGRVLFDQPYYLGNAGTYQAPAGITTAVRLMSIGGTARIQ